MQWFLEARFGNISADRKYILDDSGEAGIDAIVYIDGKVLVFQSEYERTPRLSPLKRNKIAGFEKVALNVKGTAPQSEIDGWLGKIRPGARPKVKELNTFVRTHPQNARFFLITTHSFTLEESSTVEVEDAINVIALWDLYQEGFTPPAEKLEFRMKSHWTFASENGGTSGNYATYVGLADVKELRRAMVDVKNERLFAQNVRTDLRSTINKDIKETYEKDPDAFWLYNNGIYIVCKQVTIRGNEFKLLYPSIINGSQTLHSVDSSLKHHDCKIMVRIMEMDVLNDQRLLSDVVRRTNTQNPMKLENLSAHDPVQLNVARYLDKFQIFYERRENEWKNEKRDLLTGYIPIKLKTLAQWYSTTIPEIGLGTARSNVRSLFITKHYDRIFGSFDVGLKSPAYKRLTLIVWGGLLLDYIRREMNKEYKSYIKISELLIIRILFHIVSTEELHDEVLEKLQKHEIGKNNIPRSIIGGTRKMVQQIKVIYKKQTRKDPTRDFSNFFKVNNLTEIMYKKILKSPAFKIFRRSLLKDIKKVR